MLEIVAAIGIVLFLIMILVFSYIKDVETSKKLTIYEKSIEDLNKKIYQLEKEVKNVFKSNSGEINDLHRDIDDDISIKVESMSVPILTSIKKIESSFGDFKDDIHEKITELEERTKLIGSMSAASAYRSNDEKIISMHKEGFSEHEIAKDLRIGIGEVDLVLKIAGFKHAE